MFFFNSICNSLVLGLEICPEEYVQLKEVVNKVQALGGPAFAKDLDDQDCAVLTDRLLATCKHVHTTAHA